MAFEHARSVRVDFDVAAVIAQASAYAAAIVAGDLERASSYLTDGPKARRQPLLQALPDELTGAEVVSLTVPDSGRSTTITRFAGGAEPVLLLAVWVETTQGLMIREQRIAGV
jgi:hypothetical protein